MSAARSSRHQPALAWFAVAGAALVFVLVTLGALTTTIGAGMAFPDWPLSNGSINPVGWLEDLAMFAEHSHRLSGAAMGLITIVLALWLHRREERRWLRALGWWAVAIVVAQGVLGGTRVLLDRVPAPGFEMSLGQILRIPHGVLAQVYVCVLFAIAAGLSRFWIERHAGFLAASGERARRLGFWCLFLLLAQLWVAATMRHNLAGMAIPTFPHSTPDGHWLPVYWDYRVALQFAHRVLAAVLAVAVPAYAWVLWRDRAASRAIQVLGVVPVLLVTVQIVLGAEIIWSGRSMHTTTGHVVFGALTLGATFLVVLATHRDAIESTSPPSK
jgi:cytochrome c oxidase assembly protein subunit 15